MRSREDNELLEKALRRRLTSEEEAQLEAYLALHTDEQSRWEEEVRLTELLGQLRDAPLASNFTARVLALASREELAKARTARRFLWPSFLPWRWIRGLGFASVIVAVTLISYHQYRLATRAELAESVAAVLGMMSALTPSDLPQEKPTTDDSAGASLPSWEMLENFEAIKRLNQVPMEVDVELLAALEPSSP